VVEAEAEEKEGHRLIVRWTPKQARAFREL
jgi:hypothetical protein